MERDADLGKREADALLKVFSLDGEEAWLSEKELASLEQAPAEAEESPE